jgi:8-oxo-dGTP pyrophosphatase MutT (NUDIX family)
MKRLQLAYGGVVVDESDRILFCKPRNEHDGYAWTFPEGRPEPRERPMQTAIREVLEETGYDCFAGRRLRSGYETL